ncbi:DUF177 domain-containing protein [candidate division TA06 bacterium]|uniref:DUF177 domain-containing protein n=1 Tax=candidate division TA06 bacterium TaxID=2250710 RepID=A0A933I9C4_UNCT6|nr:DUF177 domain-containing protein [candidate division TA06 bacterium]
MKIKLRQLEDGRHQFDVNMTEPASDLLDFSPVKGRLTVAKSGVTLRVSGLLEYSVRQYCSLCLKSFEAKGQAEIDLFYRPQTREDIKGIKELELKPDELDMVFYQGQEIDLWPQLRETLLLSLPVKPLCREDCRGLCAQCGKPLGARPCGCTQKQTDLRWEKLLKLKKEK